MLPYVLLVFALLIGFYLLGKWFLSADPRAVMGALKWVFPILAIGAFIALVYLRRFDFLLWILALGLPLWGAIKASKYRQKAMSGGTGGQQSEVSTRFFRMTLDHDSGEMAGEILHGQFKGAQLEDLGLEELIALWQECRAEDAQSAAVLEAYLDRAQGEAWREAAGYSGYGSGGGSGGNGAGDGAMTLEEARAILGLEEGANKRDILEAHRRLMQKVHPDHGGSNYLASKINAAKDLLLASVRK